MAEQKPVDVQLTTSKKIVNKKPIEIEEIFFPFKLEGDAALRILNDDGSELLYRSTRLGGLMKTDTGLVLSVTLESEKLIGKNFELKETGSKNLLLRGKIVKNKEASTAKEKD